MNTNKKKKEDNLSNNNILTSEGEKITIIIIQKSYLIIHLEMQTIIFK